MGTNTQEKPATPEEVWSLVREVSKSQKETDRQLSRRFAETDKRMKELAKGLRKTRDLFTNEWGRLVESLVQGQLLKLLKKQGLHLKTTGTNQEGIMSYVDEKGQKRERRCEIDIIAKNGKEIVAVEVKSSLGVKDVDKFLSILKDFTQYLTEYKGKRVYGAVAYLKVTERADIYAEKKRSVCYKSHRGQRSYNKQREFQAKDFLTSVFYQEKLII